MSNVSVKLFRHNREQVYNINKSVFYSAHVS